MLAATVSVGLTKPNEIEQAVRRWSEILALYRGASAFASGYVLVDRGASKGMMVAFWDGEQDSRVLGEGSAMAHDLLSMHDVLATPSRLETYRVESCTPPTGQSAYARVTTADVRAQKRLEVGGIWERALPEYQHAEGFCGAYLLIALRSAEGMVITLWASEENARAHAQSGAQTEILSRFSEVMVGPRQLAPRVEGFDVALHFHQKDAHHSSRGRRR